MKFCIDNFRLLIIMIDVSLTYHAQTNMQILLLMWCKTFSHTRIALEKDDYFISVAGSRSTRLAKIEYLFLFCGILF